MSRSPLLRFGCLAVQWMSAVAATALVLCSSVTSVYAQLPAALLTSVSPTGAKAGTEISVKVVGTDLDKAVKLHFSHPGITAVPKTSEPNEIYPTGKPLPGEFVVKVAADVPPGIYEARSVGRFGISNPRAFAIGTFDEVKEAAGNNSPDKAMEIAVGQTINGQTATDMIDYYKVPLKKGQHVLINCLGQRIDSRIDATIVLYDPSGQEVRRVRDTVHRDPVTDLIAPADGDYVIGLYDFVYAGGAEYDYRLTVNEGPFIDFVFPPVGAPGSNGQFTVYGRNLPGSKPVGDMLIGGSPLEELTVNIALAGDDMSRQQLAVASLVEPHSTTMDGQLFQIKSPAGVSNDVTIMYASAPLVLEENKTGPSTEAQAVTTPCEFVGQFYPAGDRDWISFEAKKGDEYYIEVVSHRLGLDTDPTMVIEKVTKAADGKEQVVQVGTADDQIPPKNANQPVAMMDLATNDPSYRLKADADATYRVLVYDLFGESRTDPRFSYRLIVRKRQPDFRLVAYNLPEVDAKKQYSPSAAVLRRGGTSVMNVDIHRQDGFEEEIDITVEGLPAGVTCDGATVGGKVTSASLVFAAADDAAPWAGNIQIVGKAKIDGKEAVRHARAGSLLWPVVQNMPVYSRMTRDLGLAVIDTETSPATIVAGDGKLVETSLGGKVEIPIKVTRRHDFKDALKLTPFGLPTALKPAAVDVKADDGKIELAMTTAQIEPGTYTFYLSGPAKFKYDREAADMPEATADQTHLDAVVKDLTEKVKAAAETVKTTKAEAAKDAKNTAAAEAAKKADDEHKRLDAMQKEAVKLKAAADKRVADLKNAKPKDVTFNVYSTPVKVRIDSSPVTVKVGPMSAVKQGDKVEVAITLEKKYGFDDAVEITLDKPGSAAGVTPEKLSIAKGQTTGKLVLSATDAAAVGDHLCTIKAKLKFNNVALESSEALTVKVAQK